MQEDLQALLDCLHEAERRAEDCFDCLHPDWQLCLEVREADRPHVTCEVGGN